MGRDCTSATTILKEEIGVVLDEVGFQECLTPLQIGHIMKDIFHNWDPSLYDQYLQKFNLPNKKEFGKFSKGMKMKLGIAVALSHHPKLLILDEATSSVDTRTEERIQMAMDNLMQGRTSFVIAHRLSTIKDADVILVMNHGDIVEQGNHEELLAKNGFYAEIYNSQFAAVG